MERDIRNYNGTGSDENFGTDLKTLNDTCSDPDVTARA